MSEFCIDCPSRGDCIGEIEKIRLISTVTHGTISDNGRTATLSMEYGVPQGPTDATVEYIDNNDGSSKRFNFYGDSVSQTESMIHDLLTATDSCNGPVKKRKLGIFSTKVCGATIDL